MNIQSLLMDSTNCALGEIDQPPPVPPNGEPKLSIKSEEHECSSKNGILSPQSLMFSRENARFWPPPVATSYSSNVFLPPARPLGGSAEAGNTQDSQNGHPMTGFVDISADQNMICPLCKKIFRFEKNLLRHMQKTHATGEAESVLKCKLCNYTTRHYSNMYVHIRTHTGDKPYSCSGCGASFTQGSSLKLHIKSRHEDNTSLFSLTKKPGKNNLTKLWTRVYKKDLSKFSNYGLGNYFSPFNVPNFSSHSPHDLLLPFNNFLSYPRLPQLSYMPNCPPQFSNINQTHHNLPILLSRFPFLPSNFRHDTVDSPEKLVPVTNSNAEDKSGSANTQTFRTKKAILSISDFVNDDKPASRLAAEERDDFKSPDEDDCSSKYKDREMTLVKIDLLDKDEENNSEVLSVLDFDIEDSSEKSTVFQDPVNDFIKTILCNQNSQNVEQLFQIFQSMGPSFLQKLKHYIPGKMLSPNEANYASQKLSQISLLNGFPALQQQDPKPKYPNNGIMPPCISRSNNFFPFAVKPSSFHTLLNQTPNHSDLSQPWSDLFSKFGQLSDKSLFHHQSQASSNQSIRTAMLPPSNLFGFMGYQPLMKMMEKTPNQFLQ